MFHVFLEVFHELIHSVTTVMAPLQMVEELLIHSKISDDILQFICVDVMTLESVFVHLIGDQTANGTLGTILAPVSTAYTANAFLPLCSHVSEYLVEDTLLSFFGGHFAPCVK
jgi:hypothetical protein